MALKLISAVKPLSRFVCVEYHLKPMNRASAILFKDEVPRIGVFERRNPKHIFIPGQCVMLSGSLCPEDRIFIEALRRGIWTLGCGLYVKKYPCASCAEKIVLSGIRLLCHAEKSRAGDAEKILKTNGVQVVHVYV